MSFLNAMVSSRVASSENEFKNPIFLKVNSFIISTKRKKNTVSLVVGNADDKGAL